MLYPTYPWQRESFQTLKHSGVENAIPSVGTQKKDKIGAIVSTYRVDNQCLVQTGPTHPWQRESSKHSGVENAIPSVGTQKRDKIGA